MKKYQIFISSTYEDLKSERNIVQKAILNMRHIPIGMEQFNAADAAQWDVIKEAISATDYLILIIGFRYGSMTNKGISFTEAEYDYATEQGIPVLVFIRDDSAPVSPQYYDENQEPVKRFKEKVSANRMCQFWTAESDLSAKVMTALYSAFERNPRSGWSRSKETERDDLIRQAQSCREISPEADWTMKQKRYKEAVAYYEKALALDPDCIHAQREMAGTYFDLADYTNAVIYFRKTIEICKMDWNYFCLGISYYHLGDYRMAREYFNKALLINANYVEAKKFMEECDKKLAQSVKELS